MKKVQNMNISTEYDRQKTELTRLISMHLQKQLGEKEQAATINSTNPANFFFNIAVILGQSLPNDKNKELKWKI